MKSSMLFSTIFNTGFASTSLYRTHSIGTIVHLQTTRLLWNISGEIWRRRINRRKERRRRGRRKIRRCSHRTKHRQFDGIREITSREYRKTHSDFVWWNFDWFAIAILDSQQPRRFADFACNKRSSACIDLPHCNRYCQRFYAQVCITFKMIKKVLPVAQSQKYHLPLSIGLIFTIKFKIFISFSNTVAPHRINSSVTI